MITRAPRNVNNFSYREIADGITISIPAEQQMIVVDSVRVDGDLLVAGELYVSEPPAPAPAVILPPDNFSYYRVLAATTVTVPVNQEMGIRDSVRVDGNLLVDGQVSIGHTYIEEKPDRLVNNVPMNTRYLVLLNEEYYFRNYLKVGGEVRNNGFITVGV